MTSCATLCLTKVLCICQGWQTGHFTAWSIRAGSVPPCLALEFWFYLTAVWPWASHFIFVSHFTHLCNENNNNSYLRRLLWGLHWADILKDLEGCGIQWVLSYMIAQADTWQILTWPLLSSLTNLHGSVALGFCLTTEPKVIGYKASVGCLLSPNWDSNLLSQPRFSG